MPITLQLNGESRSFDAELTVQELLQSLAVQMPAIVVELNRSIIPKSTYATQRLADGDCVEIVTFVGGG